MVRMHVFFANTLDTINFAEERPRATRYISLDLNDDFLNGKSGIGTNARKNVGTKLCISMVSVNVTRTILDHRCLLATQALRFDDSHLTGKASQT